MNHSKLLSFSELHDMDKLEVDAKVNYFGLSWIIRVRNRYELYLYNDFMGFYSDLNEVANSINIYTKTFLRLQQKVKNADDPF